MTLKEELEILRGEPIQVFTGNPLDIPCIETSDPERLCKHPVVSVNMITYNHEPYIRQAIEGVMMQKTDFEFELVIGEDCSTDRTREICFEYQKRYPDKIRVLWWHENLRKVQHPAGGNGARTRAHCRSEFIAFCEGDDYWIDPLKLQKQVDVMRKYPNVGFCFCGAKILEQSTGMMTVWNEDRSGFEPGLIPSLKYVLYTMFGKDPLRGWGTEFWQMTATFLVRRCVYERAMSKYDIFTWALAVGDATVCIGNGSLCDVYYIGDEVSVYRRTSTGVTIASCGKCGVDTMIVRMYFARRFLELQFDDLPDTFAGSFVDGTYSYLMRIGGMQGGCSAEAWMQSDLVRNLISRPRFALCRMLAFDQKKMRKYVRWISYYRFFVSGNRVSKKIVCLYSRIGIRLNSVRRENVFLYFAMKLIERARLGIDFARNVQPSPNRLS